MPDYKRLILRLADSVREKLRWRQASSSREPKIYYGQRHIPQQDNLLSGGLVKLQDLITKFPNRIQKPNILYLVSSSLPPNSDILINHAYKAEAPIILNQNGVAYPAWHGPGWEKTNARLAYGYQRATFIIFQSNFCKISAEKFLGPTKSLNAIINNPVNTDVFSPPHNNQRPGKPIKLLVAGSHNFIYKLKTAVDTLAYLLKQDLGFTLQIAGRCCWNNDENICQKEIADYAALQGVGDHVDITGSYTQQEAVSLFQNSDVLLHPTYNDSCPRLVVESMACGTPVVYSATGGTPELVAENAGIGIEGPIDWNNIIPPEPQALGRAVIKVFENYRYFSQGAREHAVKNLDIDSWLYKHDQIFHKMLSIKQSQG